MTGDIDYYLSIGRFDSTNMWQTYFSAMGYADDMMGTAENPNVIEGFATPMTMMMTMMDYMPIFKGESLMLMLSISNNMGWEVTMPLNQTCYITSPLSDPGYPGFLPPIPTLSQWGILVLALFIAFFSFTIIRRRLRTGNS
jgi:hypothetical protein